MSVVVSQRNRAVTQAAVEAVASARRFTYSKLFALPGNHNILDGTFKPFTASTDSGWWGSVLSDASGYLPEPAVMSVSKRVSAHEFHLLGIADNYPVDFEIKLYRNGILLASESIVGNTQSDFVVVFDKAYDADSYTFTITRISQPNNVLKVASASFDTSISNLMKEPGRRIRGRVEVTYANALQGAPSNSDVPDAGLVATEGAHGSSIPNLTDTVLASTTKFFKLYDNKLDGSYKAIGPRSFVGWWPKTLPVGNTYEVPQVLSIRFSTRNIYTFSIHGDSVAGDYPTDFKVEMYSNSAVVNTINITNAADITTFEETYRNIDRIDITIYKTSRPNRPAVLTEVSVIASIIYEDDKLVSINLLEELSYEDAIEKLGGVSANELTVVFSNEDKSFYFNNPDSPVAGYLRKNRRVRAWLGVDAEGYNETIWSPLGTYWTHSWDIPVGSLTAKAIAFDTIGLLGTKTYFDHQVYRNKSLGWLIETVLSSAKQQIDLIEWRIEEELYNTIIPVAWFEYKSYAAALNRIASCDFINIYCDREGRVVATKRLSGVMSPDDVWSDATNIIDKTYPTLNTAPPNYIDVKVTRVAAAVQEVLNIEGALSNVKAGDVRLFNFSAPSEAVTDVALNTTATYTYEAYSWGLRVTFTSNGTFNGIVVNALALTVDTPVSVHLQDDASIAEDGVIPCEIVSDFIQEYEQAQNLAAYLQNKLAVSVYDAEVTYRGDIRLTLNSKISMPEGIAQNNLYAIKRHELYWNGALSGSAKLST